MLSSSSGAKYYYQIRDLKRCHGLVCDAVHHIDQCFGVVKNIYLYSIYSIHAKKYFNYFKIYKIARITRDRLLHLREHNHIILYTFG